MPSNTASFNLPVSKTGRTYISDNDEMDVPGEKSVSSPPPEPEPTWVGTRRLCRDAFSEFMGVFILILFGNGVVAQVLLSDNKAGNYQSISWGWGIGVMLGVYVAGKSGGHINPAVTFANCLYRRFPWRKFPIYVIAQLLGAMAASAVVYANYISAIDQFEGPGIRTVGLETSTAGIFCSYPQPFMTKTGMFFSEFIASTLLMLVLYSLLDPANINAPHMTPIALFFLVFGIGACFGWETGYAINLARDFGPRLVSYMLGYGADVWSAGDYYFWIPMLASFIGCAFGGFLYDLFIYEGRDSPINTPYMGLRRFLRPNRSTWSNTYLNAIENKV